MTALPWTPIVFLIIGVIPGFWRFDDAHNVSGQVGIDAVLFYGHKHVLGVFVRSKLTHQGF